MILAVSMVMSIGFVTAISSAQEPENEEIVAVNSVESDLLAHVPDAGSVTHIHYIGRRHAFNMADFDGFTHQGRIGAPGTTLWVSARMDATGPQHQVVSFGTTGIAAAQESMIAFGTFTNQHAGANLSWTNTIGHSSNGYWGLHTARYYDHMPESGNFVNASMMGETLPQSVGHLYAGDRNMTFILFDNWWAPNSVQPITTPVYRPTGAGEETLVVIKIEFGQSEEHVRGVRVWGGELVASTGNPSGQLAALPFVSDWANFQRGEAENFEERLAAAREFPTTVSMFVNPDVSTGIPPSVEDADVTVSTIIDLSFNAVNFTVPGGRSIEDFRIGRTFESVAATPPTAPPVPNIQPGTFDEAVRITLSSLTPNARIYFTLDGSEPIPGESYLFDPNSPIFIGSDREVTIKAIATSENRLNSTTFVGTYITTPFPPLVVDMDSRWEITTNWWTGQRFKVLIGTARVIVNVETFEEDALLILAAFNERDGREVFVHADRLHIRDLSIATPEAERTLALGLSWPLPDEWHLITWPPPQQYPYNVEFRAFLWDGFGNMIPLTDVSY